MFGIVVRFDVVDVEAAQAFDAAISEALIGIKEREPGTLVYAVHKVADAPLARVFYELYTDRDAHATHEATDHMKAFFTQVEQYIARARVDYLDTPSGKVF
ncbi:MAG TPA: antibiotic biosynthesis monooxygenase [Propionibacteriaceae bacterium]|nr:antibiotic biosynthesis monooxygenase [Propionibacteriaceae bacterium]